MNGILDELAKHFEFTLWSTANTEKGKAYQYMDPIGINIIFNEWDQIFELKWLIPKSIFTIECPSCSPYTNKEHFQKIYLKFWRTIRAWNVNMPERYTREYENL
jgi:hypothetical protein